MLTIQVMTSLTSQPQDESDQGNAPVLPVEPVGAPPETVKGEEPDVVYYWRGYDLTRCDKQNLS